MLYKEMLILFDLFIFSYLFSFIVLFYLLICMMYCSVIVYILCELGPLLYGSYDCMQISLWRSVKLLFIFVCIGSYVGVYISVH